MVYSPKDLQVDFPLINLSTQSAVASFFCASQALKKGGKSHFPLLYVDHVIETSIFNIGYNYYGNYALFISFILSKLIGVALKL